MNEIFEKIYNDNNTDLNESLALFEKVYTEAEMLNEMNPKLRALLAAGLIGTAGLGAASCSMPTDDPYDAQYTIEQPTPENPEDSENPVTFESLGVADYAESLAKVGNSSITYSDIDKSAIFTLYRYKNADDGFIKIKFDPKSEFIDSDGQYNDGQIYICYTNRFTKEQFYVPVNMESDFDQAIAAYKATYAE